MDCSRNTDPCRKTVDSNGVSYGCRLKQARQSAGKSHQQIAQAIGLPLPCVYDAEECKGELNRAVSLGELSKLAAFLGIRTRFLFDDAMGEAAISPQELSARIRAHLAATGEAVSGFEQRVGYGVEPCLSDPSEILNWNVDGLRSVCKAIGIDWLAALP